MKNVTVRGNKTSTYPSLYTDKRVSTKEMDVGDFSKVKDIYMVGSDSWDDKLFNSTYKLRRFINGSEKKEVSQEGKTEPK